MNPLYYKIKSSVNKIIERGNKILQMVHWVKLNLESPNRKRWMTLHMRMMGDQEGPLSDINPRLFQSEGQAVAYQNYLDKACCNG